MKTRWLITDKGDPDALALVDGVSFGGKPHYSRQTPGARMFTRNGQNLVFITADSMAAWVTFRPTPGKAKRADKLDAWENALFRNESGGRHLSSDLIREAVELSVAIWGPLPRDGFITFIKPSAIKPKKDPGYCYLRAGWSIDGASSDGKPRLRAPNPEHVRGISEWRWKGVRGGKMRRELEEQGVILMAA